MSPAALASRTSRFPLTSTTPRAYPSRQPDVHDHGKPGVTPVKPDEVLRVAKAHGYDFAVQATRRHRHRRLPLYHHLHPHLHLRLPLQAKALALFARYGFREPEHREMFVEEGIVEWAIQTMGAFEVSPDVAKAGCKFLASEATGNIAAEEVRGCPLITPCHLLARLTPHASPHAGARRLRRGAGEGEDEVDASAAHRRRRPQTAAGELGGIKASAPTRTRCRHAPPPPLPHRRLPHHRRLHSPPPPSPLQPSVAAEALKPSTRSSSCRCRRCRRRRRRRPEAEHDARLEKAIRHEADVKHALLHTHGGDWAATTTSTTSTSTSASTSSTTSSSASGVDAIEHIVGAMWRAKGDEQFTSIVTEEKALAAIIGKDTELKTIAINAGAEDGWLLTT